MSGRETVGLVLRVAAYAFRALAVLLSVLVVVMSVVTGSWRPFFLGIASTITPIVPSLVRGLLVLETPFGGAFRGDFAIVALALFALDWACLRISTSLR